jgi:CRP-like cAMP-binding protein
VFLVEQNEGMKEISIIGPMECFGEMALLTGEPRSAGIQAITELSVLKLSKDRFDNLINKHHSLAVYFGGTLAKRLASANRDLKYYKELLQVKEKEEGISLSALPTQVAGVSPIYLRPQSSRLAQSVFNIPHGNHLLPLLLSCDHSALSPQREDKSESGGHRRPVENSRPHDFP